VQIDLFLDRAQKDIEAKGKLWGISKALTAVSPEAFLHIARRIADVHVPITMDHAARFGIEQIPEEVLAENSVEAPTVEPASETVISSAATCSVCLMPVIPKVAEYSLKHQGRVLCRVCQKLPAASPVQPEPLPVETQTAVQPAIKMSKTHCKTCGELLELSVSRFCGMNKPKFGGEAYCRTHQAAFSAR
jgi:hypothetical protein